MWLSVPPLLRGIFEAREIEYADGEFAVHGAPEKKMTWNEIAFIAHRHIASKVASDDEEVV